MRITSIETGYKIQLPAEWAVELGLESIAVLEKTAEGVLVRPCPLATWDEIFADKLPMGQQPSALDLSELLTSANGCSIVALDRWVVLMLSEICFFKGDRSLTALISSAKRRRRL